MSAPIIHILRHSPTSNTSMASCLRVLASKQSVLLIEDAVYALLPESIALSNISLLPDEVRMYVLDADMQARGLALDDLPKHIEPINYDRMVEICAQSSKVLSW
ncbi:sulfurtransferase complex subunit TusB [Halopseudomonas sp.]|uniref:sulfurtransferase complex subunit TusB n=1 Tax=Halopseudomonas sp. TaxID=2901191 RepID=UPI0039E43286